MTKIVLIIDANNLAHWLYNIPAKQITPAHCLLLVNQLIEYHNRYRAHLADIELCFDRDQDWKQKTPDFIRIFSAAYPMRADDLVLERFYFHNYHQQPHIVVTNDEDIQKAIQADGGQFLRVYDFAQLSHNERPIFLPPANFGISFSTSKVPTQPPPPIPDLHQLSRHGLEETLALHGYTLSEARIARPAPTLLKPEPQKVFFPLPPQKILNTTATISEEPLPQPSPPQPSYHLTLDTWPIKAGVRFLLQSFCVQHRDTFVNLIQEFDIDTMQSADLRVLAAYLISTCGEESNFTRQGSLMDRVRLTLLNAQGRDVTLAQLASAAGLNTSGLQGRIKEKAAPWLEILPPR